MGGGGREGVGGGEEREWGGKERECVGVVWDVGYACENTIFNSVGHHGNK